MAGDEYRPKFVIDTPVDGFGRPAAYLGLLRQICENGAVAYAPAFRSEISVGKGGDAAQFALGRALEGFNNDEGFAALRQRFEAAARSWASVHEAQRLYKLLVRVHAAGGLRGGTPVTAAGGDGAALVPASSPWLAGFHRLTGDLSGIYGLANLDALSAKRQRTLPAACRVYDLLNYTTELATHHATAEGAYRLHAFVGQLVSGEYDLEGTADQFGDWRDFFIGSDRTTGTLAAMQQRS